MDPSDIQKYQEEAYQIIYDEAGHKVLLSEINTNDTTDVDKKKYVTKYFLDLYCQESNTTFTDLMLSFSTNTETGFKQWIQSIRAKNRLKVMNEINKYVLLLKKSLLLGASSKNKLLIQYYDAKYKASKIPKVMIIGSKENLSANFKTMFPDAYTQISNLITRKQFNDDIPKCGISRSVYVTKSQTQADECRYKKVREKLFYNQLEHILKKRNAGISSEKIQEISTNIINNTSISKCATATGYHVGLSAEQADLCNLRAQTLKPVEKYVDAYLRYLSNYKYYNPESDEKFNDLINQQQNEYELNTQLNENIKNYIDTYISSLKAKKEKWHKRMESIRTGYGSIKDATGLAKIGQATDSLTNKAIKIMGYENENSKKYDRTDVRNKREEEYNEEIKTLTTNGGKITEILQKAVNQLTYQNPNANTSSTSDSANIGQ